MSNLSQLKRQRMLEFLNKIRAEHTDDDALIAINEIETALTEKKYGLVWEQHEERVDIEMQTKVPVFSEVADKEIISDKTAPYNFLLEGDNLHSLKLLEKTHKGKIDVIYIDPPYNTGNKDFVYDDAFVDKVDSFAHSKWLSFMEKRLFIAKQLLSEGGAIFISIGDNELATLKLLCDEIFGDNNFLSLITRPTGTHTGVVNKALVGESDYLLVYCKNIEVCILDGLPLSDEDKKIYDMEDETGKFLIRPLRRTGGENRREDRPNMYFPLIAPDGTEVLPIGPTGYESRWICNPEGYKYFESVGRIFWKKVSGKWQVYQKFYLQDKRKAVPNLWNDLEGNKKATKELQEVLMDNSVKFDYPKPTQLIKKIIRMCPNENAIILDFFAGSGTTAQAVLEINKEGGNRKFILCTNNESNICKEITYPRVKTVITGYRANGSKYSDGIAANLKYYETAYITKLAADPDYNIEEELLKHITEMVQLEYAVKLDGTNYVLLLSDEQADSFIGNAENLEACKAAYISTAVLLTSSQQKELENRGIKTYIIPDYYFESELLEVGER